jgi:hypothetical protein
MNGVSTSRPRPGQVLLGLFVVGQLSFLLAANFLPLLRSALASKSWPGEEAVAPGVEGTRHWARWTGQLQGWSQYSPAAPAQAVFVAVELRWDDDPHWPGLGRREVLRSASEPEDPHRYFRPFGSFRLHAYEADLSRVTWAWDAEAYAREPEEWRQRFVAAVRQSWPAMQAYLSWRWREQQRQRPDEPEPKQVVLLCRLYQVPPPGTRPWDWGAAVEQPVARWRPAHQAGPGWLPIDAFNPVTRRFEPVPREEAPR